MSVSISPKSPDEAKYEAPEREASLDCKQISFLLLRLENINVTAWMELKRWSLEQAACTASALCSVGLCGPGHVISPCAPYLYHP